MKKRLLLCLFVTSSLGSVIPKDDFATCRQEYDANVGKLVASEGVSTVTSILRLFYNDLDLNNNQLVSASEILIKLETENIVTGSQMSEVLSQMQAWVDFGSQDGDSELTLGEFVTLVDSTIGQTRAEPSTDKRQAESDICKYINSKIKTLIQTYEDISKCVSALKSDQLSLLVTGSKRMVVNTWQATFKTIDGNGDQLIDQSEIQASYSYYKKSSDNVTVPISATLRNNSRLSKSEFFSKVHDLMFGSSNGGLWNDVTTMNQLFGDDVMCYVLRSTRNDVTNWLEKNANCSTLYKDTLAEILDKDSNVAPGFIFAIADVNKDGIVTSQEMQGLVTQANLKEKFDLDLLAIGESSMTSLSLDDMTSLLPSHVVEVKKKTKDNFELSILSCSQQRAWNTFCRTTIGALNVFPDTLRPPNLAPVAVKYSNIIQKVKEELEKPGTKVTPQIIELFNTIKQLMAKEQAMTSTTNMTSVVSEATTQSTVTSNIMTTTIVATSSNNFTSPLVTTATDAIASLGNVTSLNVTSSVVTSTSGDLLSMVNDVIKDLSKNNGSSSSDHELLAQELTSLNVTQQEKGEKMSDEEKQLFQLLNGVHQVAHNTDPPRVRKMSLEERELQQLLKKVISKD